MGLIYSNASSINVPSGNRFYDWIYETEEEPHMGRKVDHARGKVLGGSSSINGMIYQRGNPMDYEGWAEPEGMETWDFAHCLPYFKRLEKTYGAAPYDKYRGHQGPIKLKEDLQPTHYLNHSLMQGLKRDIIKQKMSMVIDKKDLDHLIVKYIMVDVFLLLELIYIQL